MEHFNLQTNGNRLPFITSRLRKAATRAALFLCLVLISKMGMAQTFPPATSCTSNDLQLVDAKLETKDCALGSNVLLLGINNKTGSTRTAFALWGKLVTKGPDGKIISTIDITACALAPVPPNSISYLPSDYFLDVKEGNSYTLTDLFLAWTTPNKKENCEFLRANTATISPKCGTNTDIDINVGISAALAEQTGSCSGVNKFAAVKITTSGGTAPYLVSVGGISGTQTLSEGGSYTFTSLTPGVEYTFTIKDKNGAGCTITRTKTPVGPSDVTFSAGFASDFTKTCLTNANGTTIGEAGETDYTYSWSPGDGLSATNVGNPTANPSSTTTYEVTKTYTPTGCKATASVEVTVNKPSVTAAAGSAFTKTCTDLTSGQVIGESPDNTNYTYAWTSNNNTDVNGGLSATNIANPTANPTVTTTYTVRKTEKLSGCYDDDQVVVTVSTTNPSFTACMVQPTLCASSGSITFTASGNYEYSINDGTNYQDGSTFSGLASGSVTGLKVRNKDNGCISTMNCSAVPVCTPSAPESAPEQNLAQTFAETTEASASKSLARTVTNSGIAVKAYPNPFSSKVSFNVTSPVAGYGSLELYNMQGQKLTTVFQGRIPEGNSSYDYYVPGNSNATLVYILRVGDKSVTGKLMNVKK